SWPHTTRAWTSGVYPRRVSLVVGPVLPAEPVFLDGYRRDAGAHAGGVQRAVEVVEFVVHQPGQAVVVVGGHEFAGERGGFDGDVQGPGHQPAHVEETQAALVLLVGLGGFGGDAGIEQHDRRGGGVGG